MMNLPRLSKWQKIGGLLGTVLLLVGIAGNTYLIKHPSRKEIEAKDYFAELYFVPSSKEVSVTPNHKRYLMRRKIELRKSSLTFLKWPSLGTKKLILWGIS